MASMKIQPVFVWLMFIMTFVAVVSQKGAFAKPDTQEDEACTAQSCRELQERVQTLEEVVKVIVRALASQKTEPFAAIYRVISKSPAVRTIFLSNKVPSVKAMADSPTAKPTTKSTSVEVEASGSVAEEKSPNSTSTVEVDDLRNSSVYQLKGAVRCSLAHLLDINLAGQSENISGSIAVSLLDDKSLEITWSPPVADCLDFISGVWARVYKSGEDPAIDSSKNVSQACMKKTEQHYSIVLGSSTERCGFLPPLLECHSYIVEVVPNYHSFSGRLLRAEIVIPPKRENMSTLESLISVSASSDSLLLSWEENSGCAFRLTSVNLRFWPDGVVLGGRAVDKSSPEDDEVDDMLAEKPSGSPPMDVSIPRRCLKRVTGDGNLFSVTLSSNNSCAVGWKPLDNCRRYKMEMVSQYASTWMGPTHSLEIFTSSKKDGPRYPVASISGNCPEFHQFFCPSHYQSCFDYGNVCDRHNRNCPTADDEAHCGYSKNCKDGFKCGRQCIPKERVCDGKYDCLDGTDETYECDYLTICEHVTSSAGQLRSMPPIVSQNSSQRVRPDLVRRSTVLISAKPNQVIWLDFGSLDENQQITKVKVYDGPHSSSPVLLANNQPEKPTSVRSTGSDLLVEFYSYQNQTHGIQISYAAVEYPTAYYVPGCGGYVYSKGIIARPAQLSTDNVYYPDDCYWFVEAHQETETLVLRRTPKAESRLDDYEFSYPMTIYDGWDTSGKVLFYQNASVVNDAPAVYSISNKLLVHFKRVWPLIESRKNTSLQEHYSWNVSNLISPQCKEFLEGSTGTVKSPNYPAPYPKLSDCQWAITTAPNTKIRLLFAFFDTQNDIDFVYVFDGPSLYSPLITEKTGSVPTPFVVTSSSNEVLVRFTSEIGMDHSGFLAVYSTV